MTKPSATSRTRIVALGDSTTAGTPAFKSALEAPPKGSGDATSQYAYWLMQSHPEWEVLNCGVNASGATRSMRASVAMSSGPHRPRS